MAGWVERYNPLSEAHLNLPADLVGHDFVPARCSAVERQGSDHAGVGLGRGDDAGHVDIRVPDM
jgi:hypothetical protein